MVIFKAMIHMFHLWSIAPSQRLLQCLEQNFLQINPFKTCIDVCAALQIRFIFHNTKDLAFCFVWDYCNFLFTNFLWPLASCFFILSYFHFPSFFFPIEKENTLETSYTIFIQIQFKKTVLYKYIDDHQSFHLSFKKWSNSNSPLST